MWLFWLEIQSGGTQASAPQLRLLQLHVDSSKDLSFLGYIILVSTEGAQMYRVLKLNDLQKQTKNTKQ